MGSPAIHLANQSLAAVPNLGLVPCPAPADNLGPSARLKGLAVDQHLHSHGETLRCGASKLWSPR